ncbi:RICIN domain-containing protein [Curtobacterium citreum]|uniref:RICIN domain-containing protein n=1 Tax=Curtobacterium citreum TaxID=2036 RepID=UPI001C30EDDD
MRLFSHRKPLRAAGLLAAACVAVTLLSVPTAAHAATANLWVDPVKGSDSNPGTSSSQAFQTLAKAQSAVRTMNSNMSDDIVVNLLSGTYQQTATLALNASDSGTNGHTVRWQAAPEAQPTISGAKTISGWTSAGNGIYKASVGSSDFRQLYVNGERATRGRYPDNGSWFQIQASSAANKTITVPAASVGSWTSSGTPEMVLETQWGESYLRVKSVVVSGQSATVSFQDAESNILFQRPYPILANGSPFHWEASQAFVTQPGEWYLDNANGVVYYKPRPGENLSTASVTAPALQTLVDVSGSNLDSQASNISFSGITFTGTTWTMPTTSGYLNGQGGLYNVSANRQNQQYVGRPPAAVHVSDASNVTFSGDQFTNIGSTALDLDHGTTNSTAIGNVIHDVSGNGIMIGKFSDPNVEMHTLYNPPSSPAGTDARDVAKGNTVTNNLITRIGLDYYGTAAINAGWVNSTTITHNEISDVPWAGISVGWGWQHTAGAAGNNTVTNNDISNAVNRLCDTGAIYTLSVSPGSTFSNNYIHDIVPTAAACGSPIPGVYLDEGTDQVTVSNNVMSNTPGGTVHQNANGSNVTISNNTSTGKSVIQAAGLESAYAGLHAAVDLAQGKPASASSSYPGDQPSSVVDGNTATGWGSASSDTAPWWQVDLGSAVSVDQVQVVARQNLDQPATRTGFQIELSNDPSFATYTTVGRETTSIPDAGSATFDVNTTAQYRYVRVQRTDGQYSYLADVRVLGNATAIGSAPATPTVGGTGYVTIKNQNSGLLADVNQASTADGAQVVQYTANGGANQQWQLQSVGGGLYNIINRNSGKYLDDYNASFGHGSNIIQWTGNGGNNQLWYFQSNADGSYVIRNFLTNQAVEVSGASTAAGASLDQWIPVTQSNQNWTLSAVS